YWNTHLTETAQRYADHCNFDHDKLIQRQVPHIPLPTAMSLKTWALAIQGRAHEKKTSPVAAI
ncbi:unnamed protein product, partial [Rotaria sp. Silwood1]